MPKHHALTAALVGAVILAWAPTSESATLPYTETFDGVDGAPWPAPWFIVTPNVTVADLQGGRGRIGSLSGTVGRMILPGFAETDVEVEVSVEFEDVDQQGFGFYVRQNGGYMQDTLPHGHGYAMFLKGDWAWPEDLGIWHELDGVEIQFDQAFDPVAAGLQSGVVYRLRFRVTQETPTTTAIRAKVWPASDIEPAGWTIETIGSAAVLQGTPGTFAADVYNASGTANIFVDDLTIRAYPDPTSVLDPESASAFALSLPQPNPSAGPVTFVAHVEGATDARVRVVDVLGRVVATPFVGTLRSGSTALAWSAASDDGVPLAPGVYFVTLESATKRATRRIVVRRSP
jgi:hypothetical protein